MLHIQWPWLMLALPLPWLVRQLLPAATGGNRGAIHFPLARALQQAGGGLRSLARPRAWLRWGALLCWLLLLTAAIRPQWLGQPIELPQSGRNLMLAVDVSGSMQNTDLDPSGHISRLDVVKQVAGEFMRRREGDRIGLILFGSQAYLQTPLTLDRKTVERLLDDAVIGIAGQQTAVGDAIGMALKRMQRGRGEMVLILLTDGASNAGHISPRKAAQLAAQEGLRIYTIGVGAQARRVNSLFGGQWTVRNTELDEDTLKAIAQITDGQYFRAADRAGLEAIYRQIDRLEPVVRGSRSLRPVDELYPWPLGVALILSMLLTAGIRRQGGPT